MENKAPSVLDKIVTQKRFALERQMQNMPLEAIRRRLKGLPPTRGFREALKQENHVSIIAEIKKASPSAGVLREDFVVRTMVKEYAAGGAAAISILTEEEFFLGHRAHLLEARGAVELPLLRKDFILEPYQIYESRLLGADAILLIAALLDQVRLQDYIRLARQLGLDSLVEVHTKEELETALHAQAEIIGINNRNLKTLETNLETTALLRPLVPAGHLVVSESGIKTPHDLVRIKKIGVDAVLVGETLMQKPHLTQALKEFVSVA